MKPFILFIITILIGLSSCTSTVEQPILSGILWGGEGNMLIIRSVSDSENYPDTILIDNKGEFVWNPEFLKKGLYYLENMNGNKIILILDPEKPLFIDGQFATFPNKLITQGTNLPELFLKVETEAHLISHEEGQKFPLSERIEEGQNPPLMGELEGAYSYREKLLSISDEPLVKMVVLMQYAGNQPLFDVWNDRALFFEVESQLKHQTELNEVRIFSEKVAKLREMEIHYNKIQIGDKFPSLIFKDDTISTENFSGKSVYVEIRKPDTSYNTFDLSSYKKSDLETFILILDENEEEKTIVNLLGIMQFPSNFLLNTEGVVVAKNIWSKELKEALNLLLMINL